MGEEKRESEWEGKGNRPCERSAVHSTLRLRRTKQSRMCGSA